MTATPIPRTLAMVAYADLDCSVIDELPPGRTPVTTVLIDNAADRTWSPGSRGLREGRQAYWVCTLIEENDALRPGRGGDRRGTAPGAAAAARSA
jgi:ATP-dependent DNA helicase RecG